MDRLIFETDSQASLLCFLRGWNHFLDVFLKNKVILIRMHVSPLIFIWMVGAWVVHAHCLAAGIAWQLALLSSGR